MPTFFLRVLYLDYTVTHNFLDPVTSALTKRDRPKLHADAQYDDLGDVKSSIFDP